VAALARWVRRSGLKALRLANAAPQLRALIERCRLDALLHAEAPARRGSLAA
jgi:hypothetical protein